MIEVRLFATFREGRDKVCYLDPNKVTTIRDILSELNIPVEDVAIMLINGFHKKPDDIVKDEDLISLFPPVAGG